MRKLFPRTLKTQTLLILFAMFILSHIAGYFIYKSSRDRAVLRIEAVDMAYQIGGIVDLAYDFQGAERSRILQAAETQFLSMYPDVSIPSEIACQDSEFTNLMQEGIGSILSEHEGLQIHICMRNLDKSVLADYITPSQGIDVLVSLNFPDGQQSVFHAVLPDGPSFFKDIAFAYIIFIGVISLLVAWYLISRIVAPLDKLAIAADQIGMNIDAPALAEEGTREIKTAARAFNRMQERLRRLVHGQREMIAAISHDLRSAVTRLHLRAELLSNDGEREGFIRVVSDMRLMIQTVIDFLRGIDISENSRMIDITALVESLCHDLAEEGHQVFLNLPDQSVSIHCRPVALRRCLLNIINNAIKYGEFANVSLVLDNGQIRIRVQDRGPGVPEDELHKITQPFYRLEQSRNTNTGGIGLGLAIALNIVQAHGGTLEIYNAIDSGLIVDVVLAPNIGKLH